MKGGVGRVLNEKALEERLERAGVEIIRPETLSLREQIALFVERPSVAGTIGSSFHTSIFVQPGANIIVLSTVPGPNSNFAILDAVNGRTATYVYAKGTRVVSGSGHEFLTSFAIPAPDRVADELLAILGLPQDGDVEQLGRVGLHQATDCENNRPYGDGAMSLYSLFLNNTGRPIHKSGHYFFAYERHFGRYVSQPVTFLEIGAGNGGSSQMWKRWLGPLARIVTIDINPVCLQFEDEQVSVRIGDQSDPAFLQAVLDEFGVPDIILDDGSHHMAHVTASFDFLYSRMTSSGVYFIEDMHTAYWPSYGGGLGAPTSMVERFKHLIDLMNADHVRDDGIKPEAFTRSTIAMTAYDSILVFERAPMINKQMRIIGDDSKRVNY